MAIYKPSNLGPNLEEIDVSLRIPSNPETNPDTKWQANIFEAQVNTTGENVLAFRLNILENNTENVIYTSPGISLPKKPTNLFGKEGVKNKDFVKTYYSESEKYTLDRQGFIINNQLTSSLKNGKDYQWNIRMYDAELWNTKQPITKVCDGFLVGSTHYVIWGRWTKDQNEQLLYDRFVEFKPTSNNVHPIIDDNPDDTPYPPPTGGNAITERIQIDWVEKELGTNKDFTKIELIDSLKYNYKDGANFDVYLCDNKHTLNSAYADPNSSVVSSMFMARFNSMPTMIKATFSNPTDLNSFSGFKDLRKIIGTSTATGELRVQEPFVSVPTNNDYYVLYEFDRVNNTYKLVENQVPNLASGTTGNVSITSSNNSQIIKQKIGGISVGTFTLISNKWDGSTKRLFIQPNINIKTDPSNPNEIVFDVNSVRVDINKVTSGSKDITFNKLDNTQWLLEGNAVTAVTSNGGPVASITNYNEIPTTTGNKVSIIPGSIYTVYTDFMDSIPNGVFYARKTPTITMQYHNMNDTQEYINITNSTSQPWRDIEFKAQWNSPNNTQIKYYKYTLFDANGNIIKEGEDTYDTELYFWFRGFQTDSHEPEVTPVNYSIELLIVDELNKEFIETRNFKVLYTTERAEAPLGVEYDCEKQAFKVTAESPTYAIQGKRDNRKVIDIDDMSENDDTVKIPINKIMNYDRVFAVGYPNIIFIKPFTYLTQFKLSKDFINSIPPGGEKVVTEIGCQKTTNPVDGYDKYSLRLTSILTYFVDEETQTIIRNEDRLKFKWYKNDILLTCFDNGTKDNYDIVANDPSQSVQVPDKFSYALQTRQMVENGVTLTWQFVDALPTSGYSRYRYVLRQSCVVGGITYVPGIYVFNNGRWKQQSDRAYLFIENLSQVPGETFDTLLVPSNCRNTANNSLKFMTTGNVWIDDFGIAIESGKETLSQKWFLSYLVINKDINGNEFCNATMQMNNSKVVSN